MDRHRRYITIGIGDRNVHNPLDAVEADKRKIMFQLCRPSIQMSAFSRCLGIEKFHELIEPGDMLGTAEQVEKAHRFIFHPARRSHYSSS